MSWIYDLGASIVQQRSLLTLALTVSLAGLLFGIDTGVVSGALAFLRDDEILEAYAKDVSKLAWAQEVIVSAALIPAGVGSTCGGLLADAMGRKTALLVADVLFVLGSGLMAGARSLGMLIGGRASVGLAIGVASVTAPVFIAESSPSATRAALCSLNVLMITFGQFLAYLSNLICSFLPGDWRWMLGVPAIPAAVQAVLLLRLPESETWLVARRKRKARERVSDADVIAVTEMKHYAATLEGPPGDGDRRIENDAHVSEPTNRAAAGRGLRVSKASHERYEADKAENRREEMTPYSSVSADQHEHGSSASTDVNNRASLGTTTISHDGEDIALLPTSSSLTRPASRSFWRLIRSKNERMVLLQELHVGVGLQILQQLAAINSVMYFAPVLLMLAGVHDRRLALAVSLIPAAVNTVGSLVGMVAIDTFGRRKLFLTSLAGVVLALGLLGAAFYSGERDSPLVVSGSEGWATAYQDSSQESSVFCKGTDLRKSYESSYDGSFSGTSHGTIGRITTCSACLHAGCGFCGSTKLQQVFRDGGFCLDKSNVSAAETYCESTSIHGMREDLDGDGSDSNDQMLFTVGCPNRHVYLILLLLLLYLAAFSPGVGKFFV